MTYSRCQLYSTVQGKVTAFNALETSNAGYAKMRPRWSKERRYAGEVGWLACSWKWCFSVDLVL